MTAPGDLADRYGPWALITGASEGTGAQFALQLSDAGLNCVLNIAGFAPNSPDARRERIVAIERLQGG